ncbi:MAG: NADP-dependent isocitrate dehydrogenase [Bacteroidota bacterium]
MSTSVVFQKKESTNTQQAIKVAVAQGDGIGPEIMDATLRILKKAGAQIEPEFIDLGEKVYLSGNTAGIDQRAWEVIKRNKVILKAPITTPQGKGYKSLNVTLRKSLGLFSNVRPVSSLDPFIATGHPEMDVVIVRENEEDLYAGIEHQQTQDVVQCLKLITRPGCEKIVRYAFEYARAYGRKKVTCMVKDNIMKLTDGLFHKVFDEIALEYPEIKNETQIIDIGAARLAAHPERYDVVVTSNLYGDIISDIAAEIAGSVGLAGSANIGKEMAMFEAIHGSAPDIAGLGIANPSGLINASLMMLAHLGQTEIADKIKNAWLATIEAGYHTADVYKEGKSKRRVSTQEFADEVIKRLGIYPQQLTVSQLTSGNGQIDIASYQRPKAEKVLVGIDVFIDWPGSDPDVIGDNLTELGSIGLKLKMITNRGVKVYPNGLEQTYCTDHWRCRFVATSADIKAKPPIYPPVSYHYILGLLTKLDLEGFDVIKTENLYEFDGKRGFSLGQGE